MVKVPTGLLAAVLLTSCVNTIVPAQNLRDPVNVYLVDHGRHASLILPGRHDELIRYAYGDWRWYALSDEGVFEGIAALFWPTPGTLGRRVIGRPRNAEELRARIIEGAEEILAFPADSDRVARLSTHLGDIHETQIATRIYSPTYGLEFVRHPDDYSLTHDSNRVMGQWLEELGCQVRGPLLWSRWRVEPPLHAAGPHPPAMNR